LRLTKDYQIRGRKKQKRAAISDALTSDSAYLSIQSKRRQGCNGRSAGHDDHSQTEQSVWPNEPPRR